MFQFTDRIIIPQCNHIHTAVYHPSGCPAVEPAINRTDAASIHHDLTAPFFCHQQGQQVIIQRPSGGCILNQAAAAAEKQLRLAQLPPDFPQPKGITCLYRIFALGLLRIAGNHTYRYLRIYLTQFLQNCVQNGIITGIAPSIGAANDRASLCSAVWFVFCTMRIVHSSSSCPLRQT